MNYRADIDGLRAVAVVSVLLFHLNEEFLTGGFVGVDIFFVISGFLITKLIASEVSRADSFSFKNFYLRRVRRLFPALFFTFALSLVLAFQLFSPQHLASFGESVVYATVSLSNFLFWSQSSYFDQDNLFKPLLHTWSLSIEEQFYLIWPALLVALCLYLRSSLVVISLLVIGALSLLLNLYFLFNGEEMTRTLLGDQAASLDVRSTMFYLLPFRVFEFVMGAVLVWAPSPRSFYRLRELLFLLGIAAIAYSLFAYSGETIFPYFNAVWPCLGAALIIYAGPDHALSILLRNKVMVGIGLISYSLYLIHWPLIVFYNYWKFDELVALDYLLIAGASFVLAILMYHFVEQPFRKPITVAGRTNKPFLRTSGVLALALCVVSWNAYSSSGWAWRYPAEVMAQLSYKPGQHTEFFWRGMSEHAGDYANNDKPKVLIVGDSMAADVVNVIKAAGVQNDIDLVTFKVEHNCRGLLPLSSADYKKYYTHNTDKCLAEHTRLQNDQRLARADAIILASYWWEPKYVELVKQTVTKLNADFDAQIFVAGLKDQATNGVYFLSKNIYQPQMDKLRTPLPANVIHMNRALKGLEGDYIYFTLLDQFCDEQGCQRVTTEKRVIIFDQSHLSPAGAQFVGDKLRSANWLQTLLANKQ